MTGTASTRRRSTYAATVGVAAPSHFREESYHRRTASAQPHVGEVGGLVHRVADVVDVTAHQVVLRSSGQTHRERLVQDDVVDLLVQLHAATLVWLGGRVREQLRIVWIREPGLVDGWVGRQRDQRQ